MPIQNICVGICKIHEQYKICIGCYRSRLEIAKWSKATDKEKQDIILIANKKRELYNDLDSVR